MKIKSPQKQAHNIKIKTRRKKNVESIKKNAMSKNRVKFSHDWWLYNEVENYFFIHTKLQFNRLSKSKSFRLLKKCVHPNLTKIVKKSFG